MSLKTVDEKLDYLVNIMEFSIVMELAQMHAGTARQFAVQVSQMDAAMKAPDFPKDREKEFVSRIREIGKEAAFFKNANMADMKVIEQMSKVLMPKIAKRYPVMKPYIQDNDKGEEEPSKVEKCQVCGERAILIKEGKAACKVHYGEVFKHGDA